GVPVVEDVFEVTFALYDAVDAVEPVWTETWPPEGVTCLDDPGACVHVQGGRFQVALGTHAALDLSLVSSADGLWLGMKVETDPELPRRPLGSTPYALHASSADSAGTASGLDCTGCIEPDALSNDTVLDLLDTTLLAVQNAGYVHEGDLAAGAVPFDDATTELGADTVQGAIENLKGLIAEQGGGSGDVNEGAGQVIVYEQDTAVAAYGSTKRYVHLINPSTPKVVAHVYGDQASDIGGSGNLVVAYDFMPNEYSGGALANAGETAIQVSNPSLFNAGTHVLIHQTVGGDGAVAGTWENAQVVAVNGTTLQLVQPLKNAYLTNDTAKAQVVTAASFGHLEIVSGGTLRPSLPLQPDGSRGGIVYIRANTVSVKSGGIIDADGMGFAGGAAGFPRHQGASECAPGVPGSGQDNSCSGGGVGDWTCGGSGGGGNYTPGDDGTSNGSCNGGGSGGEVKGTGTPTPLEFGGGGGGAAVGSGGAGGGIVVLGAQTLIISEGGQIRSNGQPGTVAGAGGGAGGTVAIFADQVQADHEGATEALGGLGNTDEARGQAGPGAGWSFVENPSHNKSMNL
ncbi:MAG: hypothetical protein VX938_13025, partial [Myxococcota bacterium]|nr:hypothetical protein [Myxococcota bacterium]